MFGIEDSLDLQYLHNISNTYYLVLTQPIKIKNEMQKTTYSHITWNINRMTHVKKT